MVAAEQDLGDVVFAKRVGASVLGIFEQGLGEAFIDRRGCVAKDTGAQAHDRVNDNDGCGFATRQDIVADGEFLIDEVFVDALINAFVATADEHEVVVLGECPGERLGEGLTLGGEQDAMGTAMIALDGFDRSDDRAGLHDHAGATAVRCIVSAAVAIGRVIADVVHADVEGACLTCSMNDRRAERRVEERGKERQDIATQRV